MTRIISLLTALLPLSICVAQAAPENTYSPYAGRDYPTQVYFGDTHHHTSNSGDAFMNGDRLTPEMAYRFARGAEVVSSTGVPVRLSRPMDFLVISDHAEGLGVIMEVYNGNPLFMQDATLKRWSQAMKEGGKAAADSMNELISAQAQGTLPGVIQDPATVGPVIRSVWQQYTETAERFNEPGRFTAMIGFEWTSVPGGNNLHRNVLFRDGKARADQVLPYSSWQSEDPEALWAWMANYEEKTGGSLLAIPHNGNLSNGRMFEIETFDGKPLTADYAQRRQRWEPLQEMMQTKGASETHPTLSPNDEFADFGLAGWEYGNLTLEDSLETPQMRPTMYLRAGLQRGLEQERALGTNPFKFGFIGGTDVHNSLTSIEEDNFMGKHVVQEPRPERWEHVSKQGFGKTRYTWHYTAAGYAAVWARENTREALWDAMRRKEVYATSGSRMTVRFFAGWDYDQEDALSRDVAAAGYAGGVPMGGDLKGSERGASKAPHFLVSALKDPIFGNLDRIQIVKGWLDASGKTHEKIYDVVWADADRRAIGKDGRLTPVGNTVDVERATWADSIGEPGLTTVWVDPDFDPSQPAFYYARVIEIPTPTWMAYDQVRYGIKMSEDVPMVHQERAWTSPVWYTP
ncbi:DUF3604 domain-containing protein [Pseudohalioglobus lutimaris]|uniref:DUF3604 domain-containing protein n=1 Tax=Pseudohalioglobus lutimaris TaxID=1737061 RepID=A0A2N5WXY8_9GAMM|nr:DUF3604 domain-containing protein [Pseudohalioglobus lutimaris]PLW67106.1 hypothetical protein C0039_18485 [Pseudohalioglobus lutimaris]